MFPFKLSGSNENNFNVECGSRTGQNYNSDQGREKSNSCNPQFGSGPETIKKLNVIGENGYDIRPISEPCS